MSNLITAIGDTDATFIKQVYKMQDKTLADVLPPEFVCRAIVKEVDDDDAHEWYNNQRGLQRKAHDIMKQLEPPSRQDALADNLPEWVNKWWAPVLLMPWSSSLGTAILEAEQWLTTSE